MRNVYLHGHLGKRFGKEFRLAVDTPGAAIRLLAANFPDFLKVLREGSYQLIRGRRRGGMHLGLEEVELRLGAADFHLVPVAAGRKGGGGVIKAVLGVALVGAAIFFSGGSLAAPLAGLSSTAFSIGGLGVTWGNIAMVGLVAAVAGISQMISPAQKQHKAGTDDSYAFSGPVNVGAQGYPVPLVFGEVITGGIAISSGFDIEPLVAGATYGQLTTTVLANQRINL